MNRAVYIFGLSPLSRVLRVIMQYILRKASAILSWRIHFSQALPLFSLWVCTKRHCKIGLPQPNVTWHATFSEPAIPCLWQEWWSIEGNYETRVSQPSLSFRIPLSTTGLSFSVEWLRGWMSLSDVLQTRTCSLLFLRSVAHSCAGKTTAESSVPFCRSRTICTRVQSQRFTWPQTRPTRHSMAGAAWDREKVLSVSWESSPKLEQIQYFKFIFHCTVTTPFPSQQVRHGECSILVGVLVGAPHRKKTVALSFGQFCAEPNSPAREHFVIAQCWCSRNLRGWRSITAWGCEVRSPKFISSLGAHGKCREYFLLSWDGVILCLAEF